MNTESHDPNSNGADQASSANTPAGSVFPTDLLEWVDANTLVFFALEAQQLVDWKKITINITQADGTLVRSQILMTLLTYCYARGIYGTVHILEMIEEDSMVRYLCASQEPNEATLRHFRRHRRPQLVACLVQTLKSAWDHRQQSLRRNTGLAAAPEPHPAVFALEAENRINRAVQLDTMEMDY